MCDIITLNPYVGDEDDTIALYDVLKLFGEKKEDWYEIGRELGVPLNFRKNLRQVGTSNFSRLELLLEKWMKLECSPVTWLTLHEVVLKFKWYDLVPQLEARLQSKGERHLLL